MNEMAIDDATYLFTSFLYIWQAENKYLMITAKMEKHDIIQINFICQWDCLIKVFMS